jgi:hypothetical protein
MKLHISQPRVYPHISYLDKIDKSDHTVFSNDLVVKKNLFETRNRYFGTYSDKLHYLNVPYSEKAIFQNLKISDFSFREKHIATLRANYRKCEYFDMDLLNEMIPEVKSDSFIEFAVDQLYSLCNLLEINLSHSFTSESQSINKKSERIKDIIEFNEASSYITGMAGKEYLGDVGVPVEVHETMDERFYFGDEDKKMVMILDPIFRFGLSEVKKAIHG